MLEAIERTKLFEKIPYSVRVSIEFHAHKDAIIGNNGLQALGGALRNVINIVNVTIDLLEAKNVGTLGFVALMTPIAKNKIQSLNLTLPNSKI